MTRLLIWGALAAALAVGTWNDRVPETPRITIQGYEVLAVDFHVHPHPLAASSLPPWDLVGQARRAKLDGIAVVPHNITWVGRIARWFSEKTGGPIVLVGEEVSNPRFHMLAVGIEHTIDWRQPSDAVLAEIHAQGGIAIAAHPTAGFQEYSDETASRLDGSEVMHPLVYGSDEQAAEIREFNTRAHVAAIGDSDFHGLGQIGMCRTFVFTRERSAAGILEAVRAHRTLVYDGRYVYGDQPLIILANQDGRLRRMADETAPRIFVTPSGAIAFMGLLAALFFGLPADAPSARGDRSGASRV